MKHQLLKLAYIRKRDRKSLLFVISILLFSSFSDEIYLAAKQSKFDDVEKTVRIPDFIEKEEILVELPNEREIKTDEYKKTKPSAEYHSGEYTERKTSSLKVVDTEGEKPVLQTMATNNNKVAKLPSQPIKNLLAIKIDPSEPNIDDLIALGIPKKVAFTWSKYANAGGEIRQKEDLNKIYGMEQEHVEKLNQHMTFPKKLQFNKRVKLTSIYMNKATAYEFSRVPGIGPVLSERIVKFRDKLGGFHNLNQLNEVYGIEPELVKEHKDLFLIEVPAQKLNINTCDEKLLGAHSYCSYRVAKAIINYRKQNGNFTKSADLRKIRIINEEWLDKISPYLEF